MESVETECVDRSAGKPAEACEGVVEVHGPIGEAQPRQVERDRSKASRRESVITFR